jgi:DCN1-like protein 4/5
MQARFGEDFCTFLTEQQDYKKINTDQWTNFLKFEREVKDDLSNYDDNPAWPLLLDNFVEWLRKKRS